MKHTLAALACLSFLLTACEQQVDAQSAAPETAGEAEVETLSPTVRAALEVVPAARPYVDLENGPPSYFDYGAARAELGAIVASELETEWENALSDARIHAT